MSEDITTKHIAQILGLSYSGVYFRQKSLGLLKCKWTEENILKVSQFKPTLFKRNSRNKILIIEYFLKDKRNSYKTISEKLGISEYYVNKTLSEWIENDGFVFVCSKLNNGRR